MNAAWTQAISSLVAALIRAVTLLEFDGGRIVIARQRIQRAAKELLNASPETIFEDLGNTKSSHSYRHSVCLLYRSDRTRPVRFEACSAADDLPAERNFHRRL